MNRAAEYFTRFIKQKNLRMTKQREIVVRVFLGKEGHLGIDELYSLVKKKYPEIGYATVWRTLNLLKEAKIASEVSFTGKKRKYEHLFDHKHHDHLICLKCGRCIEIVNPKIEQLQEKLARQHGFKIRSHRLEIFGFCLRCSGDKNE
ncbi:MAG: transcriptional repressor [Candidatus Saganbacteria bacterium]|nr:transcriptional repressor [Candidatus Saganbacteria bacterium]